MTRTEQRRVLTLLKREAWLKARVAVKDGKSCSFDHSEASAIRWAIEELAKIHPEISSLEYTGSLTPPRPADMSVAPKSLSEADLRFLRMKTKR